LKDDNKGARFALVINEANRGNLFNALNRIWWEKRRNYPSKAGVPKGEQLPPNLALIFTENPATADYATIGDGDDALYTRLPPECTFALVRGGTNESELTELGVPHARRFSTENVGLFYAATQEHEAKVLDDPNEFNSQFKCSKSDFCQFVAGKQIEIINDHPPPPDDDSEDESDDPRTSTRNSTTQKRLEAKDVRKLIKAYLENEYNRVKDDDALDVNLEFITDTSDPMYPTPGKKYFQFYEAICQETTLKGVIRVGQNFEDGGKKKTPQSVLWYLADRMKNINKISAFVLDGQRQRMTLEQMTDTGGDQVGAAPAAAPAAMDTSEGEDAGATARRPARESVGARKVARTLLSTSPGSRAQSQSSEADEEERRNEELRKEEDLRTSLQDPIRKGWVRSDRQWTASDGNVGRYLVKQPIINNTTENFFCPTLIIAKDKNSDTYLVLYKVKSSQHTQIPRDCNKYNELILANNEEFHDDLGETKERCQDH